LIEQALNSTDPRASTRAARSLGRILSGFLPKLGRQLSADEISWHNDERIRAVEIIRARVRKGDAQVPLVRQLRKTLRQLVRRHIDSPVMTAIDNAIAEIQQSDELFLFDAICTGEWERDIEFDSIDLATRHTEQQRRLAVNLLRK